MSITCNEQYFEQYRQLDRVKLMSRDEVLAFLTENGEHEPSLAKIADQYETQLGFDPIWRYPLSDDMHEGAFIVPVKEGFMWLPYDEIDTEYYEILLPDEASMLDAECCDYFKKSLRDYTDQLCKVFSIILQSETQKEG